MMQDNEYIAREQKCIRFLYKCLYPGQPLDIHMWWEGCKMGTPAVQEQSDAYGSEMLGLEYIGRMRCGPPETPQNRGKRVFVTVSSPRQVAELSMQGGVPWKQRPLKYRALHSLSPMLGEFGKFLVERHRLRVQTARHRFSRLPMSRGASPAEGDPLRKDKAPAALIGLHWLDVGGAESLGLDSINWALETGLRVFVLVGQIGPERLLDKLPNHPQLHLLRSDRYLPRHLQNAFIGNLVEQENIVLTHNHHCLPLYDALPTIKMRHPHVVNLDSTHIVEYLDGGYPRISGVWSNYLDYHHVISQNLMTFYQKNFRQHGRKLLLGRLLDDSQRIQEIVPLRICTGQTQCRIAFVGRMVHQKRPALVVAVMRSLLRWGKRNGVEFSFDMVGEGPYREAVEQLIRRYRMGGAVRLHEAGCDVQALLRASDILLLPSSNEGLALVCYEAIEAGCVAISSDVGAQRELCPAELLVDWDPWRARRQIVTLVARLLQEPGFAQQIEVAQQDRLRKLRAEPSAREVLTPIYAAALQKADVDVKEGSISLRSDVPA